MAARRGPTFMRVMLGMELRALREKLKAEAEAAGEDGGKWTAEAVSARVRFSRARLSRVEAGEIPIPKLADLERLLDEYGVSDVDDRDDLKRIHLDSLKTEPITSYRAFLPSGLLRYLALERDSVRIRAYKNNVIHGLLQTQEYATALIGGAKIVEERTTEAIERSIQARVERKALLVEGREVHIILAEASLRTCVGSPELMRGQYAEIIRLCELDTVDVQIIPAALPTYRVGTNFTVLEFDDLTPVVQSDGHRCTTMWSKPSDVGQFTRQFDAMAKAAPGPSETPRILKALEEELWK
ncbi:helix-turn-helix domain-containing protein [Streptomyces acidiscabies]|uniref:helix-turn-helix domain-containing protein n=1 Tax=Streptomyces acidiscabies TaxID=42234 RepID=UPI00096A6123|nr:helix-turn-helix transcriptional regulator [Streptomyces acidiscabies]